MEGITQVATGAATAGHVVQHTALSIQATSSRAGIATLLIEAGTMCRTVRVDGALGLAMWWRAIVLGQATADGLLVDHTTLGIRTTG